MEGICDECGRSKKTVRRNRKTGKFVCYNCRSKNTSKHKVCNICKRLKEVVAHNDAGKPICRACYVSDTRNHKVCLVCGKTRMVAMRTDANDPICRYCYVKDITRHETCVKCGKFKAVNARYEHGMAICENCQKRSKIGVCKKCGHTKIIQAHKCCANCNQRRRRAKKAVHSALERLSL